MGRRERLGRDRDLARYHDEHATDGDGTMTRQCLGGPPGASAATQSIIAFDTLAEARGAARVTNAEIAALAGAGAGLSQPTANDTGADPAFGRAIYLRRRAGPSRLTIFEGAHEWLPAVAMPWLADHRKP